MTLTAVRHGVILVVLPVHRTDLPVCPTGVAVAAWCVQHSIRPDSTWYVFLVCILGTFTAEDGVQMSCEPGTCVAVHLCWLPAFRRQVWTATNARLGLQGACLCSLAN